MPEGNAKWLDKDERQCLVLWKKMEDWADAIHQWAMAAGMQDMVTTVDELSSGDEVRGTGIEKLLPKR